MFDIKSYLSAQRDLINRELENIMPEINTPPAVLHEAMRYSVFPGGKRIRPILCLTACTAVGADSNNAIPPALALELLHTYTLIHDDLPCMDDDDTRRGMPSSHIKFGEANAILAGDALQAMAFEAISRSPASAKLLPELAVAAGSRGVIAGQVLDISTTEKSPSREIIEFIHLHKTADLFRASMRLGGIAGNASESDLEALTVYGVNIGLAFQITDDVLDNDENNQELSCLSLYESPDKALSQAETLINEAIASIDNLNDTEALIALANLVLKRKD